MKYLIIILLMILSGCAVVAEKGAAISDDVRESAEFALCKGITVGAWVRAYGNSAERAQAWRVLCGIQIQQAPK